MSGIHLTMKNSDRKSNPNLLEVNQESSVFRSELKYVDQAGIFHALFQKYYLKFIITGTLL